MKLAKGSIAEGLLEIHKYVEIKQHTPEQWVKGKNQNYLRQMKMRTAASAKLLQSCPTLWPHRRQPTRLPHPWDSPGKNTGVGCHFLLQCIKVKSESEVAQSCPTPLDPMDCSPPGSSTLRFSRQEYWSGVPLPSLLYTPKTDTIL